MNKEKKKYTVTIFGDQYVLVSDETQERVMRVSALLDSLMHEIAQGSSISDPKKIAVLAGLQIADKLVAFQEKEEIEKKQFEELARAIDQECLSGRSPS